MNRTASKHSTVVISVFFVVSAIVSAAPGLAWIADGVPVCVAPERQKLVRVISTGTSGGSIVMWVDERSGPGSSYELFAQALNAQGDALWTSDGVLVLAGDDVVEFVTAPDGSGGVIVVWGNDADEIRAQRVDANGNSLWGPAGEVISSAGSGPAVVPDGEGGAFVAWRASGSGTGYDVFAQMIDSGGNVLWAAQGVTVCSALNAQWHIDIVSDARGGAILAWEDGRNPSHPDDIYVQRLNRSGVTLWTADGVAVSATAHFRINPAIVGDGTGGVIACWEEWRDFSNGDVYAQRVALDGTRVWGAEGTVVWAHAGTHNYWREPKIVADPWGGAIVAWESWVSTLEAYVFAQKMNAAGSRLWDAGGVEVCDTVKEQYEPSIVADGAGGAVLAWADYRGSSESDVYAQKLDEDGVAAWTPGGVPVSTASWSQGGIAISTDGFGGAIVAWEDGRGELSTDIYAARIFMNGVVTAIDCQAPPGLVLAQNSPNPFNSSTRISFTLPEGQAATLSIYDVEGRHVRTLVDGFVEPGLRVYAWNGRDSRGCGVASGVYFYRLTAGDKTLTKKMLLLR